MKAHRRTVGLLAVFIMVMSLAAAVPASSPPPAKAGILPGFDPCNYIPNDVAKKVCKAAEDPVGTVVGAAGSAIGSIPGVPNPINAFNSVVGYGVDLFIAQFADAEASGVDWLLNEESKFINDTTTPNLMADWFKPQYALGFGVAFMIALLMLVARVIDAVRLSDPSEMVKGGGSFIFFLFAGSTLLPFEAAVVQICDGVIAPGWMAAAGKNATQVLNSIGGGVGQNTSAASGIGQILVIALFLLFAIGAGLLTLALLVIRFAVLYVLAIALVFALSLWVGGRLGGNRAQNITMALIGLSTVKIALAVILTVGLGLVNSGVNDSSIPSVLMGTVLMWMLPGLGFAYYRFWSNHQIYPRQVTNPVQRITVKAATRIQTRRSAMAAA